MMGATSAIGWVVQGVLVGSVAVALAALWRSKTSFDLKAAALAVGTVMVVPYIFLYDLVILAVAMAFLLRACGEAGPTQGEMRALALAARHFSFGEGSNGICGHTGDRAHDRAASRVHAGADQLRAPADMKPV